MRITKYMIIWLLSALAGCHQSNSENTVKKLKMPAVKKGSTKKMFTALTFASKKDLVCGMPISAGISDTAHYKGKLYGFCAAECKAEFIKSPKTYLTLK